MGAAASSAYWTAAARARESGRADRLFADEFAADLAGERGMDLLRRKEQRQGREDVLLAVRTRWFDDAVLAAVPAGGAQVVELGAGLDTRPCRVSLPAGSRTFELDQESVLRHKAGVLAGRAVPYGAVTGVAVDLAAGWAPEGLLMYLSFRAGLDLLDTVTALSGEGCVLIFDTLARRVPSGSGAEARFCPDDVGSLLRERGWAVRTQETVAAPARAYGRATAALADVPSPAGVAYFLVVAVFSGHAG
jgi:O-methyltransferase involved in polyketide biosynthesis